MGRKPIPEDDRKQNITLRLTRKIIEKMRQEENYNAIVQKLLEEYFKMKK